MNRLRILFVAAVSVAAVVTATSAAEASQPPRIHTVNTYPFEGSFVCGDLTLTASGGTYTEKIVAVLVNGLIHYNAVRTYHRLTLAGSDGATYRAAASAHETILLTADGEPISSREVNQTTFFGPHGSPGYVHEILTLREGNKVDRVFGPCQFAD